MSGWIKLHRSIQDHFIYDFSEPDKAMAWIDILLSASYQESKVKVKSTLFTVSKGQWLVSQVTLQKRWRMSQNKVKRLLKLLENDGMIRLNANDLTSVITICNYNDYQDDERPNEQPHGRAGERGSDEQANDIQRNKELKNKRNKDINNISDKLDFSEWPQQPDPEILKAWLAMRKRVKASCSQLAMNTIGNELGKAVQDGFSVDQCLRQAEASGWKGFKSSWVKPEEQRNGYQNGAGLNRHEKLQQWSVDTTERLERELAALREQENLGISSDGQQEFIPYVPDVDS